MTKPNNLLLFVFFEYFDCTENIHDNLQIHQGLNQVRTCEHGERPGGSQEGKKCALSCLSLLEGVFALSPLVSHCTPSCFPLLDGASALHIIFLVLQTVLL